MTHDQNQKPALPELQELNPLIEAGDWDAVDKLLDEDYALKVAREKTYKGMLENETRSEALNQALLAAVGADKPETVSRILRLEDFNIVPFIKARHEAAVKGRMKVLRVFDKFVANMAPMLGGFFDDTSNAMKPVTDSRVQADRISRVNRRKKGLKP